MCPSVLNTNLGKDQVSFVPVPDGGADMLYGPRWRCGHALWSQMEVQTCFMVPDGGTDMLYGPRWRYGHEHPRRDRHDIKLA